MTGEGVKCQNIASIKARFPLGEFVRVTGSENRNSETRFASEKVRFFTN